MSSTTRAGFLIPAVGDFADETLYYDNNVTVLEAELPSLIVGSLPGSGNYNGRIRTTGVAATAYAPTYPEETYVYNGGVFVPIGAFGFKKTNAQEAGCVTTAQYIQSSGSEVFTPAELGGAGELVAIAAVPNTAYRFCCSVQPIAGNAINSSAILNAKFNIFINPNSASQPTPTTPGTVRLSFPIFEGDDLNRPISSFPYDWRYGELLYSPAVNVATTMGAAAYFSATLTNDTAGYALNQYSVAGYNSSTVYSSTVKVESMGQL